MKMRLVVTFAGFAIGFALPAFTQEKEEVNPFPFHAVTASPQLVKHLEAINLKFDEACNKHDAAAIGALYIAKAVQVTPVGTFSGREAIEKYFTDLWARFNDSDRVTKISYVYAFAGDLCAIGGYSVIYGWGFRQHTGGYLVNVYTRVGNTWKIRASMLTYQAGP
jgi:ketosteroid isomerase-like protein